jgi:hypothetical protein
MAVNADSNGRVTGHFTVPANVPPGAKLVEFRGAGGSKASATFVGRGQITTKELRQVRTETTIITRHLEAYDPLAETFTLANAVFISSADVWVCNKGSFGTTLVQLRETIAGLPTREVIAEARVPTTSLLVNQYHRFTWPPVRLEAGVEYALVIGCDDAQTALGVAELGKFDPAQQKWVTSQPYQVGVLLSSSNGSTWTPHQDKDLTFRLNATPLAATTRIVALPDVAVTNCDEIIVLAAVERPTEECDVTFTITLPDNTSFTVAEGERVLLPVTVNGTLKWRANLSGTLSSTPRLHPDVQLVWCTRATTATYVTRAITAGTGSKVSVYYEATTPGTSSILIQVCPDITVGSPAWQTIPVVAGVTLISDGGVTWIDTTARITGYAGANAVVRITLAGNAQSRPQVRKLRVVIT